MDLLFNGKCGRVPAPGSIEAAVLDACMDPRAWRALKRRLEPGDFEAAIERLCKMGWGFVWGSLQ